MQRPRLALALAVGALLGTGLALARPAPSVASTSSSYTTTITVGASHTLPNGAFGFSDGCRVGYDGATEYRCAFEFDISIPSTAKITAATLSVRKTAGFCGLGCPVDVYAYNGNGSDDLSDVSQGSLVRIFTPNGTANLDVSADLQSRVSNGLDWIGYRMARDPSSPSNPDWQDFAITGADRVQLSVSYVAQPVDVTVHLGGLGTGVVTSSPDGISCGEFCDATYEYGEPVTLTATPLDYGTFSHWEGGKCPGSTNPVCEFVMPELNVDTTAVFDPLAPPISQPPGATPTPVPTQLTPPPLPTARASSGPVPSGGPLPTAAPAPTDVIASDGTVITPPPPTLAPGATAPAPTIVGLGDPGEATASGGVPLPVLIVLILILGGLVGGGVYWFTKRQQAGAP